MNGAQFMVHVAVRQEQTDLRLARKAVKAIEGAIGPMKASPEKDRLWFEWESLLRVESEIDFHLTQRCFRALARLGLDG